MSDIVPMLRSTANLDARAGEPLGKCMREAADYIESLEAELATLRAQIKRAEEQKPVAWFDDGTIRSGSDSTAHRVVSDATKRDMPRAASISFNSPLYAYPIPSAPVVPEGWKLVPINLTEEMEKAGGHLNSEWLNDNAPIGETLYAMPMRSVWQAMLAAAPSPTEKEN